MLNTMKQHKTPISASEQELESLGYVVDGLGDLAYKVATVREQLVLAGVGTFSTQKEHAYLMRLEIRIDQLRSKLSKLEKRTRARMPESPVVTALKEARGVK